MPSKPAERGNEIVQGRINNCTQEHLLFNKELIVNEVHKDIEMKYIAILKKIDSLKNLADEPEQTRNGKLNNSPDTKNVAKKLELDAGNDEVESVSPQSFAEVVKTPENIKPFHNKNIPQTHSNNPPNCVLHTQHGSYRNVRH